MVSPCLYCRSFVCFFLFLKSSPFMFPRLRSFLLESVVALCREKLLTLELCSFDSFLALCIIFGYITPTYQRVGEEAWWHCVFESFF